MGEYAEIRAARNGREIRYPLSAALREMSESGRNADSLNSYDEAFFGKKSDIQTVLPFDEVPVRRSTKLVTSGGIWSLIGDIDNIDVSVKDIDPSEIGG